MIVNGSREGANTDAAASQVDHFTQEVLSLFLGSCPTRVVPITNKPIPMTAKVSLKEKRKGNAKAS